MGTKGYENGFKVTLHPERLEQPLRLKKPRMIFVCSMGDLFHPDVPFEFVDKVFAVMALCSQHTFQCLTKRPERMAEYHCYLENDERTVAEQWIDAAENLGFDREPTQRLYDEHQYPLPNVWLGTSIENQPTADERIPHLLECSVAARFISCEPLLFPIDFWKWFPERSSKSKRIHDGEVFDRNREYELGIHQIIVGGETGPGARPMQPEWVHSIRDQCRSADVPFFFKGWGGVRKKPGNRLLDGREWNEMPKVNDAR